MYYTFSRTSDHICPRSTIGSDINRYKVFSTIAICTNTTHEPLFYVTVLDTESAKLLSLICTYLSDYEAQARINDSNYKFPLHLIKHDLQQLCIDNQITCIIVT